MPDYDSQGSGKHKLAEPQFCDCGACSTEFQTCTPCLGFGRVLLDGTDLWKWAHSGRVDRGERFDYALSLLDKLED